MLKDGLACEPAATGKKKRRRPNRGEDSREREKRLAIVLFASSKLGSHSFGRSSAPRHLLLSLQLNAPERRHVGAHPRGETGGRIVEHGGGWRERKGRGDGGETTPLGLACFFSFLWSTKEESFRLHSLGTIQPFRNLSYLSSADTHVGRDGGEENRLRGGSGSCLGVLLDLLLLLLLGLLASSFCRCCAAKSESREDALQGAGSGHLLLFRFSLRAHLLLCGEKADERLREERVVKR